MQASTGTNKEPINYLPKGFKYEATATSDEPDQFGHYTTRIQLVGKKTNKVFLSTTIYFSATNCGAIEISPSVDPINIKRQVCLVKQYMADNAINFCIASTRCYAYNEPIEKLKNRIEEAGWSILSIHLSSKHPQDKMIYMGLILEPHQLNRTGYP